MMHKWSKLALTVLLAITAIAATACGSDSKDGASASPDGQKPAKEVTITFWHHYSTASPEEKTLTEKLIPQFEAENPGIKVKAVAFPWEELHKKIQVGASSGSLPDVARLDIIWVPEFAEQGILKPLEGLDGFADLSSQVLAGPMSTGKVGDSYYGFPLNTNTKVLFWNKEMFAKSGIDKAPETTDEFFSDLEKLKTVYSKGWGYGEPALQGWNILPWIWSNGGDILSPDFTTAEGYLNSEASVAIMTRLQQAAKDGYISGFKPGDVAVTEGHAKESYGMMAEGPWAFAQFESQFPDFDTQTASFPKGSAGSIQVLGGEDLGIFSKDKQEESWKFIKFMVSEASQVEMGKVGQIPVNIKAGDNADIKAISYYAPFLEQLKTAKARPPIAEWPQIDVVLSDAAARIMLSGDDVKTVLDQAVAQIDKLLQ